MRNITLRDAVVAAVAYADIFDFPLTEEEVLRWLPFRTNFKSPRLALRQAQSKLQGAALRTLMHRTRAANTYYSLPGGRNLMEVRAKRARCSAMKWLRAQWAGRILRVIPTIRLVGATGGLAMHNVKQKDDIDVFIIVSSGTLWTTRLLATVLMEFFGVRRLPKDTQYADKICLNMFMSEDALALPRKERDLFAAHEVLQMVPLWERGKVYKRFLAANRWVGEFLPNAWVETHKNLHTNRTYKIIRPFDVIGFFRLFEPLARSVQRWYMKRRRTTEVVSHLMIRFHPVDARVWVKRALGQRLRRYNIPLDKIFYGR